MGRGEGRDKERDEVDKERGRKGGVGRRKRQSCADRSSFVPACPLMSRTTRMLSSFLWPAKSQECSDAYEWVLHRLYLDEHIGGKAKWRPVR
jgi:hypothetical protein